MYKKCNVVMLPTKKAMWPNCIWLGRISKQLHLDQSYKNMIKDPVDDSMLPQHLYIISDDEIKDGDWCYDEYNKVIFKNNSKGTPGASKKIIATTDRLNKYSTGMVQLPQLSQSFIEEYVEEYNKGNIITDVLVEHDENIIVNQTKPILQHQGSKPKTVPYKIEHMLKVNPKDNTITIKKVKDSWNREEHIEGMWKAYKASNTIFEDEESLKQEFNEWIEDNL